MGINRVSVSERHGTEFLACGKPEPHTVLCSFYVARRCPIGDTGGGCGAEIRSLRLFAGDALACWAGSFRTKMPGRIAVALYVSCVYYHHRRFFFRYSLGILKDAPISHNH